MTSTEMDVIALASELIRLDTRSDKSNLAAIDLLHSELGDFEVERLDFNDAAGTPKAALVAYRGAGRGPCLALSAHTDTVPPIGWTRDPFRPEVNDGRLYGLGSCDMKGPLAAALVAAKAMPDDQAIMLLLSCDEETTKEGARRIVADSKLLPRYLPAGIIVVEPTELQCVRGHRVDIQFIAEAKGIQAHSALAHGQNANIDLIPFVGEMRDLYLRLRTDPTLQDPAYYPTWCDLNIIIDNHGAASNVTVGRATCRIKFRYSKSINPSWVVEAIRASASRHNVDLVVRAEGNPPELDIDHPLVRNAARVSGSGPVVGSFGTDASQLSTVSPCVVMGPGSMQQAHKPDEFIDVRQLVASVPLIQRLVADHALAASGG